MAVAAHISRINLRPAGPADKYRIYRWLAHSDATASMFGPPLYPELPAPSWKEFCQDYGEYYFDGSRPLAGRCFIIIAAGREIGAICHDKVYVDRKSTNLDIWLHSASDQGKGFGPAALRSLVGLLSRESAVTRFIIDTSRRNSHAIAAYLKTGFREISRESAAGIIDFAEPEQLYADAVFLLLETPTSGIWSSKVTYE
jgi:diamine N-acetyltransferase